MPLVYVQRFGRQIIAGGTQYITGTLSFTGPTVIELDPAVFTQAGPYVLFDYSANPATGFPGGQAELDAYVTIDGSSLIGRTVVDIHGTNEPANNRITVTLS